MDYEQIILNLAEIATSEAEKKSLRRVIKALRIAKIHAEDETEQKAKEILSKVFEDSMLLVFNYYIDQWESYDDKDWLNWTTEEMLPVIDDHLKRRGGAPIFAEVS